MYDNGKEKSLERFVPHLSSQNTSLSFCLLFGDFLIISAYTNVKYPASEIQLVMNETEL